MVVFAVVASGDHPVPSLPGSPHPLVLSRCVRSSTAIVPSRCSFLVLPRVQTTNRRRSPSRVLEGESCGHNVATSKDVSVGFGVAMLYVWLTMTLFGRSEPILMVAEAVKGFSAPYSNLKPIAKKVVMAITSALVRTVVGEERSPTWPPRTSIAPAAPAHHALASPPSHPPNPRHTARLQTRCHSLRFVLFSQVPRPTQRQQQQCTGRGCAQCVELQCDPFECDVFIGGVPQFGRSAARVL